MAAASNLHDKNNETKERLMINDITLFNFKSYHGKRTIGPFHK